MSVLIKGIELPEKVQVLELHSDGKVFTRKGYLVGEAVELPERHGRLIDADELKKEYPKDEDWEYPVNTNEYVCETIDKAKTVIEAEDGT